MFYTLITGASTGIGKDLAYVLAEKGQNLILVARRIDLLEKIKSELSAKYKSQKFIVINRDLSRQEDVKKLHEEIKKAGLTVNKLVNNAGFGHVGKFDQMKMEKVENMINLNVLTLTTLTHLFVRDMVELKEAQIINIASTAGFRPGPLSAVYFATKAYVLSFSQGLNFELSKTHPNISIIAICPGATDTEFRQNASMKPSTKEELKGVATSKDVATFIKNAMDNNTTIAIEGIENQKNIGSMNPIYLNPDVNNIMEKVYSRFFEIIEQ